MPIIKIRRGTTQQWAASTRILQVGELGIDTSLNKIKAGNGVSVWSSLPFISADSAEISEIAQDAISTALSNGTHTNITVTYNDNANSISLSTGPDVVTTTSLGNSLTDPINGYVPISDVGQPDGVASLDSNGKIPDSEIPTEITRNTSVQTLINKTINLGTGITSISAVDDITGLAGQNNIIIYQSGLDKGGRINISSVGVISIANSGIGYVSGLVTNAGGTRFNITVGGNALSGTLAEFNAALTDGDFATESYVGTAISNLVDTAPATLNTLNELAAALGDDPNYATTITTALGNKLDSTAASSTYLTQTNASSTYLTQTNASSTYLTQTNASSTYLTQTNAASTYAPLASPTFTGTVTLPTETIASSDLHWEHYANESDLPAASAKHGMFAHVHGTGGAYFAHAGAWYKLAKQSDVDLKSDEIITINAQTSNYTLDVLDLDKMIEMSGGGTLTITDSASFPVGFTCNILQTGSSQVTIAGSGFTPNATPGLKLRTQWSSATLVKRALNSWVVMGDLSA
jgi:Major tropism determinant N-terminal domain